MGKGFGYTKMSGDVAELYECLAWGHGFIRGGKIIIPINGGTSIDWNEIVKKYGVK